MSAISAARGRRRRVVSFDALETRTLFSSPHQPPTATGVDMVMRWNNIIMDTLRADRTLPGPGWSSRNMAIADIAIYDAVNTLDGSFQPYLVSPHGYNANNTSMDAAVAAAAHRALVALYPAQQSTLDAQFTASLADVPNGPQERRGVALGEVAADAILANRAHDGSGDIINYTVDPAAGHWQPDPINPGQIAWGPGWGLVKPFAINSGDQFRAPPPPAMDSPEYLAAYNEVKSLGEKNSATRTADQTQIGHFWAYDIAAMGTPPTEYCQATEVLAAQQNNSMVQNARLMALMSIAQADAGIAAWDTKYAYDLWRPVAAIRRGADDGNDATTADPTWTPLGAPGDGFVPDFTPPFPAYVSGHATFGAATFRMLADFYGTNSMSFTLHSDELPGVTRSFSSFSQAADENAQSRIYLGIHWSFDATAGVVMGDQVADWVIAHALLPKTGHGAQASPTPLAAAAHTFFTSSAVKDDLAQWVGLSEDSTRLV